ncbi:MAG: hypothetical protein ACK587_13750 [Cyanobacteriota bacterium]
MIVIDAGCCIEKAEHQQETEQRKTAKNTELKDGCCDDQEQRHAPEEDGNRAQDIGNQLCTADQAKQEGSGESKGQQDEKGPFESWRQGRDGPVPEAPAPNEEGASEEKDIGLDQIKLPRLPRESEGFLGNGCGEEGEADPPRPKEEQLNFMGKDALSLQGKVAFAVPTSLDERIDANQLPGGEPQQEGENGADEGRHQKVLADHAWLQDNGQQDILHLAGLKKQQGCENNSNLNTDLEQKGGRLFEGLKCLNAALKKPL